MYGVPQTLSNCLTAKGLHVEVVGFGGEDEKNYDCLLGFGHLEWGGGIMSLFWMNFKTVLLILRSSAVSSTTDINANFYINPGLPIHLLTTNLGIKASSLSLLH